MSTSTEPAQKTGPYQNVFVVAIVLFLVATAVTIMQYKIPTIMVPIMEQFAIDANTAAWTMSIFTFTGIFLALPVGMLSRKFGPKNLIIAALILDIVASVAGAFVSDIALLLVTRALEGAALVCVIACGPVVLQQTVDPARMGIATGIWMLGGMLGATFGGIFTPLLYYNTGFVGLWIGYAIFTAIALIAFVLVIKMSPVDTSVAEQEALANANKTFGERFKTEYRVFFKPNTWLFYLPHAIFQILLLAVLSFAPTALQQQGMDPALSGLVSTIPMLLAIISSLAFGAISDAIHRCKPLVIIGIVSMAICTPIMLNITGPVFWGALVVMGLLAMGMPTVVIAAYPQVLGDPKLMTVGMGVLLLVQSIGQFLGSLVPGMLLGPDISNWFVCGAVLCVLGLIGGLSAIVCKFK